jgi:hypothetical protein
MSSDPAPRFNHVALSVPPACLDEAGRAALLRFYGDVFGWTEMPGLARDRELLVLRAWTNEQFVYLVADADPMRCPSTDHFGLSVATPDALRAMAERARKAAETDPDVELSEIGLQDFGLLKLHNFYVRYRLPMSVEVQCFEWVAGVGPDSLPGSDRGDVGV